MNHSPQLEVVSLHVPQRLFEVASAAVVNDAETQHCSLHKLVDVVCDGEYDSYCTENELADVQIVAVDSCDAANCSSFDGDRTETVAVPITL